MCGQAQQFVSSESSYEAKMGLGLSSWKEALKIKNWRCCWPSQMQGSSVPLQQSKPTADGAVLGSVQNGDYSPLSTAEASPGTQVCLAPQYQPYDILE